MTDRPGSQTTTPEAAKYIGAHPPEFSQEAAAEIARAHFGVAGSVRPLWGERDQNFAIHDETGPAWVVKISNMLERPEELDLQLQALGWLERNSPDLPVPRILMAKDGANHARIQHPSGTNHAVHVISHLGGIQLGQTQITPEALHAAGAQAGAAARALSGFYHAAAGHALFWDIRHVDAFAHHAEAIRDAGLSRAVTRIVPEFCAQVKPALERLRAQIIHHDTNPANVLVDPDRPDRVIGLVDFGDTLHGPVVQDVAVAAMELVTESRDVIGDAARVVAGYDSALPLEAEEIDLIYDLMVARACLGLLIGVTRVAHGVTSAEDQDYEKMYAPALEVLLSTGRDKTRACLRDACRFPAYTPVPPAAPGTNHDATETLIARRRAVLGQALPLTYDTPLHTEKGRGVWLYDADGQPHLDCYNNVAHVGHCHPHVVRTVARQAATLNTNTRYAFDSVVSYAERLGALMPGDLSCCLFVNSGSEAVDLALRMAKAVAGQDGMLAMDGAYHGITAESYAVSPATEWDAPDRGNLRHVSQIRPDIALLQNPDTFRGPYGIDANDVAALYAADADRAISTLQAAGHPPGVFVVDTAFSSIGILDVPDGYLPAVAQKVRAAGGMVISDEVQYGFGRSGRHFWGFEKYGLTPDFVTLGKPMGNGIAVGCVVTTPDILERFSAHHAFFSTFGGNPVACAAAGAVLDVMEREGLQQNARETGAYLIEGLRAVAQDSDCIGDVRGEGFFVGVDIVRQKGDTDPDGARCSAIKNSLRRQGILVSSDGFHENVLKIRPPMVFGRAEAERLIDGMRRAVKDG